jgi:hypothetical protein
MPNTARDLITIRNYWVSGTAGQRGWYDLNSYRGTPYFNGSSMLPSYFPSTNININMFYGLAPTNEWDGGGGGGK